MIFNDVELSALTFSMVTLAGGLSGVVTVVGVTVVGVTVVVVTVVGVTVVGITVVGVTVVVGFAVVGFAVVVFAVVVFAVEVEFTPADAKIKELEVSSLQNVLPHHHPL